MEQLAVRWTDEGILSIQQGARIGLGGICVCQYARAYAGVLDRASELGHDRRWGAKSKRAG